jgi:tetratricopeptide (TPR) repeat protein
VRQRIVGIVMNGALIGRRYQILSPLGSGGMGSVYRAFDRLSGQVVALKQVLAPAESATLHDSAFESSLRLALAHEFKLLATLRHPHIIDVLDYGFHQRQPYYTMELLEGAQNILEAGYQRPLIVQVNLLVQFLQALAYLHRRGILHRDLKPNNVLVVRDQVKVLDFGLATTREHYGPIAQTVGTLAYMAPEILRGGMVTEATDLYAVGVLAHEMFMGHHPYNINDTSRLIDDILHKPLDFALTDVQEQVAQVLQRLLAKDPALRYYDANAVIAAFSESINQALPTETVATRESFLQSAPFVGRETEIALLSEALESAVRGVGSAWLVGGESGVGKSRLLEELRIAGLVRGAAVARGQSVNVGRSAYHVWRGIVRWLVMLAGDLPMAEASLLAEIVPDISALLGQTVSPANDVAALRRQMPIILEALIRRQAQPLLLIVEDLQWAGEESLALLAHLTELAHTLPLLIVGSYRNDETPDLPDQLPHMRHLPLERLSDEAIAQLSAAMLGAAGETPPVLDLLQRETEGNVFFLIEVVRALAEEAGQLSNIGRTTLPRSVFAGGIRRLVQRRLSRLSPADRPLLQLAAVDGRTLDIALLAHVAREFDITDLEAWLLRCADAAVLEVVDEAWHFVHDKLRVGALTELNETALRHLHRVAAQAVEVVYPNQVAQAARLAYLWMQAGDGVQEARYTVLAGAHSLRIGLYPDALVRFERALTLLQHANAPIVEQVPLRHQLAEAHLGLGNYAEAQAAFEENLVVCRALDDVNGTALALLRLGDIDYALERYQAAEGRYQESLILFRSVGDKRGAAQALNGLGNVAFEIGEDSKARLLFQESLTLSREIGAGWGMGGTLGTPSDKSAS